MGNTFSWPTIRLVQRLSMILTLGCSAYVIFFLLFKNQENSIPENNSNVSTKGIGLVLPSPVFDLTPYQETGQIDQARDIFSLPTNIAPSGTVENTPKGQLPGHLKVVGIAVGHPSQIVIEDSFANKTYFVDEGNPQAGIKIVKVSKDQMIINYQGQDIAVPINKN
jgi:type II secretory pathway component PulC